MSRGRHRQPDEVKALRGNPGKRRLALQPKEEGTAAAPTVTRILPPAFLTEEREREIFTKVIEDYLQRRIARPVDITAYGRWASYVHRWLACKEQLDGKATWYQITSNHGQRLARHPIFKDMLDLEHTLQSLEDRLGLNPVARQNIIRGLAAMPSALGGLFGEEVKLEDKEEVDSDETETIPVPDESPLGFLQTGGKPN